MKQYHVTNPDGTQTGPYDQQTLLNMVKSGAISPDCHVWCAGMSNWQPFRAVFAPKKKPAAAPQHAPYGVAHTDHYNTKAPAKKSPVGLIIGIVAGIAACAIGVTCWLLFFHNSISSDKDLYEVLSDKDQTVFYPAGESHSAGERLNHITVELAGERKGYHTVKSSIILLNNGDAAEYLLRSKGAEAINAEDFLEEALECGAHNVVKALIDHGVTLEDGDKERMLHEILDDAEKLHNPNFHIDGIHIDKLIATRNYKKCAQYAIEELGVPVIPKEIAKDLAKLELKGKEEALVEYVKSKL